MPLSFDVWLLKTKDDYVRATTLPRLPMIFETEDTATQRAEMMKLDAMAVKGTITFQEVIKEAELV